MELLKKGDKVNIIKEGAHASDFNTSSYIRGVYNIDNWEHTEFEIEGTVKLITSKYRPDITHAYKLVLNGVDCGFVYNDAIQLAPDKVIPKKKLSGNLVWK